MGTFSSRVICLQLQAALKYVILTEISAQSRLNDCFPELRICQEEPLELELCQLFKKYPLKGMPQVKIPFSLSFGLSYSHNLAKKISNL